jgi:predicted O-methyltransferase YrrM
VQQPSFLTDDRVAFGATEIRLLRSDTTGDNVAEFSARDDVLFMLKSRPYVDSYLKIGASLVDGGGQIDTIAEIGVYRGGSAAFLHQLFKPRRIVCVDLAEKVPAPLEAYARQHAGTITTHFGVSQDDRPRVAELVRSDMVGQLDVVVDDASHIYEPSKATFEMLFPMLAPGGIYVLEDWDWSHSAPAQEPDHYWAAQSALTNLVLQLVVAHASAPELIREIGFGPGLMWVRRGWLSLEPGAFSLASFVRTRGRILGLL